MDQLDSFGRSAMHLAAMRGKLLCLRTLLQHGAGKEHGFGLRVSLLYFASFILPFVWSKIWEADPFRVDQSNRNASQLARAAGYEDCAIEVEEFCASLKVR